MLFNMVLPGAAGSAEGPFAFEYSGNFTDNRVDGVGTVRLNTSGTLTVTGSPTTITVYMRAGGGGGACLWNGSKYNSAGGGGGGYQTIFITLEPGIYEIVIGIGGAGAVGSAGSVYATHGGDTIAFGATCTGGRRGVMFSSSYNPGEGGTPNGGKGNYKSGEGATGGSPNGGKGTSTAANNAGGDGYVELIFS